MTNYKEILRMKANGFSMRAIANILHCNWRTVKTCIQKADEAGIVYPWEGNLTNEQLYELFYPKQHYRNLEYVHIIIITAALHR